MIPWRRWQPTPVSLPGKSHGQKSLVGYTPWGHKRVGHNLVTNQQQMLTKYPQSKGKKNCQLIMNSLSFPLFWILAVLCMTCRMVPLPGINLGLLSENTKS